MLNLLCDDINKAKLNRDMVADMSSCDNYPKSIDFSRDTFYFNSNRLLPKLVDIKELELDIM